MEPDQDVAVIGSRPTSSRARPIAFVQRVAKLLARIVENANGDLIALLSIPGLALLFSPTFELGALTEGLLATLGVHWRLAETVDHVARDLGIALIVSTIVGLLVDYQIQVQRHHEGIDEGRSDAVGQLVQRQALRQIAKLNQIGPVFCSVWDFETVISLRTIESPRGPKKRHVSRGTLSYTLKNSAPAAQPVILRHELERDIRGMADELQLPRVISMRYEVSNADLMVVDKGELKDRRLSVDLNTGDVEADPIRLPPYGSIQVWMEREEGIGSQFPWFMYWVTEKATVRVKSGTGPALSFSLSLRPKLSLISTPLEGGGGWEISDGLLPGQGFSIDITGSEGSRD